MLSLSLAVLSAACLVALASEVFERGFNPAHHSGGASPYFEAPTQFDISPETPAGCIVDQAAYIVRHASRYPEPSSFVGWQALYNKLQNATYTANGNLAFLPSWVPPVDDLAHEPLFLSATGAREAFQLGTELRKRYNLTKGGENFTVWSAGQQRCIDTATHWLRGYLGQGDYLASPNENRGTIVFMPDSVNTTGADSLTASAACPLYTGEGGTNASNAFRATYQNGIAKRINQFLDGLELNATDVGVMQDLCGYSFHINGDRRFCDIFQEHEWIDYEYASDLNYYYGSGPGNPLAGTTAFPWLQAITQLLVAGPNRTVGNGSFVPPPLIMGFTHDNDLPPVVAALGIMNSSSDEDVYPLSLTTPDSRRTFRSSYLVSFLGNIALERLSCETPMESTVKHVAGQLNPVPGTGRNARKFVRVRANDAPVPIPACMSGPGSSCPLADFEAYVKGPQATLLGDFVQKCGLANVTNDPDTVDFYVNINSKAANTSIFMLGVDPQVGEPNPFGS
ncbi:hypothetical protein NM688_g332 [Phlebia brevispora]|uniref:Uncharacterized protein n=1 Tax=Phlebia brevispora TaxID=194682 RepID=A0ACC1TET0_9APHY|nr:hypothetical protein NM688_g332 [Phlebia brevispora]